MGTEFAYYVKVHGFHWNVESPDFYQYHKFLQKIYEDAYSAIDPTAEYIRSLGEYAPGSLERFLELSVISAQTKIPRARLMLEELLANSGQMVELLDQCFAEATQENKQDVANFIAERLSQTNKFAWQLRSSLKENRA
ncbi:DNA starvation/stationary phase protection protein [Haliscomenobacter sp.]|uniref:Dps family protein n=1 Tax=Haliscomenobacter sp. TaxID=2717303 RepID=UPI003364EB12